jgi:hypothetical protein
VPHPPLLPTPPPPAIPPQLLPPHPGPPPQKLIPNAPSTQRAPTRPVTCSSAAAAAGSSRGVCSSASGGPATTQELGLEDVLASGSASGGPATTEELGLEDVLASGSGGEGLLGLFRQQQGLQHRWQQVSTCCAAQTCARKCVLCKPFDQQHGASVAYGDPNVTGSRLNTCKTIAQFSFTRLSNACCTQP